MTLELEPQLSEKDLNKVARTVVDQSELTLCNLARSLEEKLAHYSDDVHYRATAIGLIYMLANHLRHYAAMTSIEDSVELAAYHLRRQISSNDSNGTLGSRRSH